MLFAIHALDRAGALPARLANYDAHKAFLSDTTRDHGYVDTGPLIPSGDEYYRLETHYLPNLHVWVPRERVGR